MKREALWLTWPGALLLSVCSLPQAVLAYRDPVSTAGLSWWFLGMWLAGEWLMLLGLSKRVSIPVLLNYAANIGLISYICLVKLST